MSHRQRLWFHGTTSAAKARSIMRDGFKRGTYFARHLEDALAFGGRHVFVVEFYIRPNLKRWQVSLSNRLPPDAIVSYHIHTAICVKGQPIEIYNRLEHPEKYRDMRT